jgi:hypothetical protein
MPLHKYDFVTAKGEPMRAVVETGGYDRRNDTLSFYPRGSRNTEYTGFTYYVEHLLSNYVRHEAWGLRLHTEIPEWHIDANSMIRLFDWLESL